MVWNDCVELLKSVEQLIVCSSLFSIYRGNCYEPISSRNELGRCACEIHVFVQILGPKFGLLHVSHWVVQNLMLLFKYQTIVLYTCNAAQVLHSASNPKSETWMTGGQQQSQANSGNFNQTVSTGVSLMYSSVDATVSIRQSQCLMQRDQLLSLALRDDSLARLTLGSRRCHILGDLPVIGNVYRPETLGKTSKKSCRNDERCVSQQNPTDMSRLNIQMWRPTPWAQAAPLSQRRGHFELQICLCWFSNWAWNLGIQIISNHLNRDINR